MNEIFKGKSYETFYDYQRSGHSSPNHSVTPTHHCHCTFGRSVAGMVLPGPGQVMAVGNNIQPIGMPGPSLNRSGVLTIVILINQKLEK